MQIAQRIETPLGVIADNCQDNEQAHQSGKRQAVLHAQKPEKHKQEVEMAFGGHCPDGKPRAKQEKVAVDLIRFEPENFDTGIGVKDKGCEDDCRAERRRDTRADN